MKFKHFLKYSPILFTTFYFLFSIILVNAAYLPLVPCQDNCTFCDLLQMAKNITYFLLEFVAIPAAVIMIAYGAFNIMFAAGNEERAKKGRGIIQTAIFGAVIALAAWVIVNTIISILGKGDILFWKNLPC